MNKLLSKWKSMPDSVKSSVAFAFSVFFLKGVSFLATSAFTRIMETTEYGVLTKYNSWVSILEVFALIGMTSGGIFNSGLNDYRDDRDRYISSSLIHCNSHSLWDHLRGKESPARKVPHGKQVHGGHVHTYDLQPIPDILDGKAAL